MVDDDPTSHSSPLAVFFEGIGYVYHETAQVKFPPITPANTEGNLHTSYRNYPCYWLCNGFYCAAASGDSTRRLRIKHWRTRFNPIAKPFAADHIFPDEADYSSHRLSYCDSISPIWPRGGLLVGSRYS